MKWLYFFIIMVANVLLISCKLSSDKGKTDKYDEDMPGNRTGDFPKVIDSKDIVLFEAFLDYGRICGDFIAKKSDDGGAELTMGYRNHKTTVGPEFLVDLQEIIDKHGLAKMNGIFSMEAVPPGIFRALIEAVFPTRTHADVDCKYESGEIIKFSKKNPGTGWMKDITELFDIAFSKMEESDIHCIHYGHRGMPITDIYSFEIIKEGLDFSLRTTFFDPEDSYSYTELTWEGEEYSEIIKSFYNRVVKIIDENNVYSWKGFDEYNSKILDGSGFDLSIDFENGSYMTADGSNAFPPGFFEVEDEFLKIMDDIIALYHKYKSAE